MGKKKSKTSKLINDIGPLFFLLAMTTCIVFIRFFDSNISAWKILVSYWYIWFGGMTCFIVLSWIHIYNKGHKR